MELDYSLTENRDRFEWDMFLESRGLEPAPNNFFHHVEKSQQNLLAENMTVEVCHSSGSPSKYWYARVTMKCGPFLRLLYEGQEDTAKELWADPTVIEIRPVGFAEAHNSVVEPPSDLKQTLTDWQAVHVARKGEAGNSASLLSPAQQIKVGMNLEVESLEEPRTVRIASVLSNVGGRLHLKFGDSRDPSNDWLFCLSPRLHPLGWAAKQDEWKSTEAIPIVNDGSRTSVPEEFFQHSNKLLPHLMEPEARVKVLKPSNPDCLHQGTIREIIDKYRFSVQVDEDPDFIIYCTLNDGLVFRPEQLGQKDSLAEELKESTALEAVNPANKNEICAAFITAVEGPLLRLHLEGSDDSSKDFYISSTSHDLFPVGWCESHSVPLRGPSVYSRPRLPSQSEHEEPLAISEPTSSVSYWCPKIYFNFRCFSGPLLSKARIAALPRSVGPGPIVLVLKEVLTLLVNGGYKPSSVLRQLQCDEKAPTKGMHLEPLKAKYRQNTYRAMVPIASTAADIDDYFRWVCEKLQCCPYLFGPVQVDDPCPKKCSVLARAHGQHKKKQGAWLARRKFEDLLKHAPVDVVEETEKPVPVAPNPATVPAVAPAAVEPEPVEEEPEAAELEPKEEPKEKKRRGRPRKNPLPNVTVKEHESPEKKLENVVPPGSPTAAASAPEKVKTPIPAAEPLLKFPEFKILPLKSNPRLWSPSEVSDFLKNHDCGSVADLMVNQNIDGVSLMLLNLSTVLNFLTVSLDVAWKLCYLIGCVQMTYFNVYEESS